MAESEATDRPPDAERQPPEPEPAAAPAQDEAPAPAPARPAIWRRRGCLIFGAGVLVGLLGTPLLLWLVLTLLSGSDAPVAALPPPSGQPDLVVTISREYLQRSAASLAAQRNDLIRVQEPRVELRPHPAGGAQMVVRADVKLPLLGTHGTRTDLQLLPSQGQLAVQTEQIVLGRDGQVPLPGQSLIKGWISELISESVEKRLQSSQKYAVEIVEVQADSENLIVKALLKER